MILNSQLRMATKDSSIN